MSATTQVALAQLAGWLRKRAESHEGKFEKIVEVADFGTDDLAQKVDRVTYDAIDLLARADEARLVVLELERKATATLRVVEPEPADPFVLTGARSESIGRAIALTVAKCIRGVADARSRGDTEAEVATAIVAGMLSFARDVEAGELSATEFVADMFGAACEQVQT